MYLFFVTRRRSTIKPLDDGEFRGVQKFLYHFLLVLMD
jgi:hypothetical protein